MGWLDRLLGRSEGEESPSQDDAQGIERRKVLEYRDILRVCCDTHLTAMITWPDQRQIRWFYFHRLRHDSLELQLVPASPPFQPRPTAGCGVTFLYNTCVAVFATSEKSKEEYQDAGEQCVLVELPAHISMEGRRLFRVPVATFSEVEVHCFKAEVACQQCVLVDISAAGAQVLFDYRDDPLFDLDDPVELELAFEGARVRVAGLVRRCNRGPEDVRFGIVFRNTLNGFIEEPARELNELVRAIERSWLRARLH